VTEDKSRTDITITKDNPEKQTTQNTAKQNYPVSVASYDTRPGNEVGLFYNSPEPHGAGLTAVCWCSGRFKMTYYMTFFFGNLSSLGS